MIEIAELQADPSYALHNEINSFLLGVVHLIIANQTYGNCPKILYISFSDELLYANSAGPSQTAPDLHCFQQVFCETNTKKSQKSMELSVRKFRTFKVVPAVGTQHYLLWTLGKPRPAQT